MTYKANRLLSLWVSLIEEHKCNYLNCNSNFKNEIEIKMIRKVHKKKKIALIVNIENRIKREIIIKRSGEIE